MIKKRDIIFLISISLILILPLINAENSFDFENAKTQFTSVIDSALGILSPFFEKIIGDYNTSEFFFSKILLMILLIVVCKKVLDKTPFGENKEKISLLISVIVSILAIRFINENNFFEAILIQYGTLGIAITTIIPLIIFFYFVHNSGVGSFGRKIFWALYGIILLVLWLLKSKNLPEAANWIYGLTFIAVILFVIFDKTIHSYLGISGFKKFEKENNKKIIRELKEDLEKLEEHFQHRRMSFSEYKEEKKALEEHIKALSEE